MNAPWETGGEFAALTEVIFNSLRPPAKVICRGTEGAGILGWTGAPAARQTVHPGEEVLFEPPQQLQHHKVFNSKFTFYQEQKKYIGPSMYRSTALFTINTDYLSFICETVSTALRKHQTV